MAFADPIATSQPGFGAKANKVTSPGVNSWWGPSLSFPYPTNSWFMDFVLTPTAAMTNSGDDRRTTVWPYMIQAENAGLTTIKPFIRTYSDGRTLRNEHNINYDATATNWGWTSDTAPAIWRALDLRLRSTESIVSRYLQSYDELSATLRWNVDGTHYMEAPIVKGMPYVTMRYTALTPVFETDNTDYHAITTVNGAAPSGTVSGTKFKLTINRPYLGSGATETWILYASSSITFTASSSQLVATAPFTGYLRLAVVPSGSAAETTLDTYKDAVPVGGSSAVSVSGNVATTTFSYTKTGAGGTLLMYCLPHHEATLSAPSYVSNFQITTIRGTLRAVTGNTWTMTDQLSTITWDSPNAIDSNKLSAIQAAFNDEKVFQASDLDATEAYLFGKQIARAGRLALIANQLGDLTSRNSILAQMKSYLNPWFDNNSASVLIRSLMYDTTWGGVISTNAHEQSPAGDPQNANQEFGNAVYNDHYFHWGYFIYGAAVIAHFDSAWATAYKTKVNDMIRDIANPSFGGDPYFTQFRHHDWYEGHSWAAGLQANGDGRNQESASEALNAWYGINLWGLATSQTDLRNVGRYLQAKEARAAQLYWQMPSYNTVYPPSFAAQKVIPLVFANKVFNGTWFGLSDDILVGIETLPFTPASHELLPKTWMQEAYPAVLADNATPASAWTPGGWLGYTYAAQAIINPDAAFTNINTNISTTDVNQYLDQFGASKTNLLWWSAVQGGSGSAPTATATTITGAVPSSPSSVGTSVTFTAQVSPAVAGTVTFFDGVTQIGSASISGSQASISTSSLAAGTHSIIASFVPTNTAAYGGSTSASYSYTVNAVVATTTSTTLSALPTSPAVSGANVTFTATVAPATATGTVAFKDGAVTLGTGSVVSGTATYVTGSLAIGAHSITAVFSSSDTNAYTNSTSSILSYSITTGGGPGTSNANTVPYLALSYGQPQTAVRRTVNDTNYTIAASDTIIAYTALTAARVVTLVSSGISAGKEIVIKDESGACSVVRTITISGTIDGQGSAVLNTAYAVAVYYFNGTSWSKIY